MAWIEQTELGGVTHAYAWPFDQGLRPGKPEYKGQDALDLFGTGIVESDPNLGEVEWVALLGWLTTVGVKYGLVAHNAPFDCRMVRVGTRDWAGTGGYNGMEKHRWLSERKDLIDLIVWDTQVGAHELDPTMLTGLGAASSREGIRVAGVSKIEEQVKVKGWLKRNRFPVERYDLAPWDVIRQYATNDAEMTIRLAVAQQERFACGEASMGQMEREMRKLRALYRIESVGLRYDSAGSLAAAMNLAAAREALAAQLPFKATVNGAKSYYFGPTKAGGLGLPPYETTGKGAPKLDAEIAGKLVKDGHPWAAEYGRMAKLDTAISMWYRGYPEACGRDGRLRTVFRTTKTVTGRTSVERVNLQAIPHDYRLAELPAGTPSVRSFILPDEGMELWELDLAQAELRVAAKGAQAKSMLKLIYADADLHGVTCSELFGISKGDADWFEYRQVAKRSNFSLIFDVGARTFQQTLAKQLRIYWPLERCQATIYRWHKLYPEFKPAVHRAMRQIENRRWLRLSNGRIRHFSDLEVQFESHKAFNGWVQGGLGEMASEWMVEADATYPGTVLNYVHDSLVVRVEAGDPDGVIESLQAMGKRIFEEMFDVVGGVDAKRWNAK